ncbi:MAG TPA: methyltransferase domain-containing protein [Chloroflexia bacterium]|nr:methyltransferase domain-containing protein [Chloroflexia bacterium]
MSHMADAAYLLNTQYRDSGNLRARMGLHEAFSTNPQGWQRWVFDQLGLPATARVLEVGCGPGRLWRDNGDRIPPGWTITLVDFSAGMLERAEDELADLGRDFIFEEANAESLPLGAGAFDAVIANHMLYHVPDRERAIGEMRRVLAADGTLYAATNGAAHMRELDALLHEVAPDVTFGGNLPFTLENGAEQLAPFFADVRLERYEDALAVTEAAPLLAYVDSSDVLSAELRPAFAALVAERIAAEGAIRITKDAGLFVARKGTA